ncbi:MAG: diphthine synthase [Candidatus Thermoplasmatota archaeon]|nr:diphthine synthase [Candidatus Thermoplasmatota archaeon]
MRLRGFRKRLSTEILNLVGSGLRGTESLTAEELEILRRSDFVFIDGYTSIFPDNFKEKLEKIISKGITILGRNEIETFSFLEKAGGETSLIVSGDPLASTTHFSVIRFCNENRITWKLFENASIMSAVPGRTGLSSYRTGTIVSLPDIYDNYVPVSPLQKIVSNIRNELHTIMLIDLKKGKNLDIKRVLEIIKRMVEKIGYDVILDMPAFVLQRVGWEDENLFFAALKNLPDIIVKSPYCIVLPFRPDSNELENMHSIGIDNDFAFRNFDYSWFQNESNNL